MSPIPSEMFFFFREVIFYRTWRLLQGGTRVEITAIVPMYTRSESSERSFTNISEFPLRPKRRKKYQTGEML